MANGTTNGTGFKMPGFFVGGGIALSNTALLLGLLGIGAFMYFKMQKGWNKQENAKKIVAAEMKPAVIEDKIMQDVVANAAYKATAINNQDRIKEYIRRMEPEIRGIRNNYRDGIITREQYINQIRSLWQRISMDLKIPINPPEMIPPINKGMGFGWGHYW